LKREREREEMEGMGRRGNNNEAVITKVNPIR